MEKDKAPKTVTVGTSVINSIAKYQGKDGVSLSALKKLLRDAKNMDTDKHDAVINMSIKNALNRGLLVKEKGNYKVSRFIKPVKDFVKRFLGCSTVQNPVSNRRVLAVIRSSGSEGITVPQIKRYFLTRFNIPLRQSAGEIKRHLRNDLNRGIVIKDGRRYKARTTRGRSSRRSENSGTRRRGSGNDKNIDTGVQDCEMMSLKRAIDRGLLVKEGRNYKVKAAGSKRTPSKRRSKSGSKPRKCTGSQSNSKSRLRRSSGRKKSKRGKSSNRVA